MKKTLLLTLAVLVAAPAWASIGKPAKKVYEALAKAGFENCAGRSCQVVVDSLNCDLEGMNGRRKWSCSLETRTEIPGGFFNQKMEMSGGNARKIYEAIVGADVEPECDQDSCSIEDLHVLCIPTGEYSCEFKKPESES